MSGCDRRKPANFPSFLRKTLQILEDPSSAEAACWAADGRGFLILNEELFAGMVLPRYFKHSNYSSFVRQLNMYNFHKVREPGAESYFYHEMFRRGCTADMAMIKRKPERKKRVSKGHIEHECRPRVVSPPTLKSKDECTKASEEIKSMFQLQLQSDQEISIAERMEDTLLIQPSLNTRQLMYPSKGNIYLTLCQNETTSLYSLTNLIK